MIATKNTRAVYARRRIQKVLENVFQGAKRVCIPSRFQCWPPPRTTGSIGAMWERSSHCQYSQHSVRRKWLASELATPIKQPADKVMCAIGFPNQSALKVQNRSPRQVERVIAPILGEKRPNSATAQTLTRTLIQKKMRMTKQLPSSPATEAHSSGPGAAKIQAPLLAHGAHLLLLLKIHLRLAGRLPTIAVVL
jgi:hypothetical protein